MAPAVIDLKTAEDPRDAVQQAVAALAEGKLVAVPTETVYGIAASALSESAVQKLLDVKNRDGKPLALAIKSSDDALDYVPGMSPLAQRLSRRCWPGPVTLVLKDNHPDSVLTRLPAAMQSAVTQQGNVGLRVPANEHTLNLLRLSAGPLVLSSANLGGHPPATTAEQVVEQLGDSVDLILDDGPSRFGQASTVVQVTDETFEVLREGVVSAETLAQLTFYLALVVCTGNTCRSPMGEGILRDMLAQKIGCDAAALPDRGISVRSAGIAAMPGGQPALQAVDVMNDMRIDITNHASQPVTDQLAKHADLILTMTNGHRNALVAQWPELAVRTHLFSNGNTDISDPIGQPKPIYAGCADQLKTFASHWVDVIVNQALPGNS